MQSWERGSITCLVSKLTKQYPRGCPSRAPDLWKRKSNCFTVPNFCRSFRRWYLWGRTQPISSLWEFAGHSARLQWDKSRQFTPGTKISHPRLSSSKLLLVYLANRVVCLYLEWELELSWLWVCPAQKYQTKKPHLTNSCLAHKHHLFFFWRKAQK